MMGARVAYSTDRINDVGPVRLKKSRERDCDAYLESDVYSEPDVHDEYDDEFEEDEEDKS